MAGPIHVTLMYGGMNGELLNSYIDFNVYSIEVAEVLDPIPEILTSSEFHWSSIKVSDFTRSDRGVRLNIHSGNVVDCLDFFLNYKLIL
jgi:hypothetical protein